MKSLISVIENGIKDIDYMNMSYPEIAKKLNCNEKSVRLNFKKLGIDKKICRVSNRVKLNKIKDLIQEGKNNSEIAKLLGLSNRQITVYLNKQKISNKENKGNKIDLTEEEYQVILGSILGDGCINKSKNTSTGSRLAIKHSIKQLDYVKFKFQYLNRMSKRITIVNRTDNRFKEPKYQTVVLETSNFKLFAQLRKSWYTPYKKITEEIFNLNALGLAIWFMDDGYRAGNTVCIATQGFKEDSDKKFLIKVFKNNFKIDITIRASGVIYVRQKDYYKFYNLVSPYVIESMKYKLPIKKLKTNDRKI